MTKTYTVRAMPDEAYRNTPLRAIRYQQLRCPECGSIGDRVVLVGQAQWEAPQKETASEWIARKGNPQAKLAGFAFKRR